MVQMILVGGHHRSSRGIGQELPYGAADDCEKRIEHRDAHREKRNADGHHEGVGNVRTKRKHGQKIADHHRPGIAKEHRRGIVVVSEKPNKPACERKVERSLRNAFRKAQGPRHANDSNKSKACRKAVKTVNQVKGVYGADDPKNSDEAVKPRRDDGPEIGKTEARPPPCHDGDHNLPRKLNQRFEGELVVYVPKGRHRKCQDEYAEEAPVGMPRHVNSEKLAQKYEDGEHAYEYRYSSASRDWNCVDSACVGIVDHPEFRIYLPH